LGHINQHIQSSCWSYKRVIRVVNPESRLNRLGFYKYKQRLFEPGQRCHAPQLLRVFSLVFESTAAELFYYPFIGLGVDVVVADLQ
jgi:hypothetical protein